MKKKILKSISCIVAGSLICANLAGCGAKEAVVEKVTSDEQVLNSVIEKVVNAGSSTANKEETVYVKTTASGDVSKVTVSNWLKNADSTDKLTDSSDLKDIVNVKGDEDYTVEDGKIVWNANGNDIYYQGTTDRQIPISVAIKYTLDGKEVTPEEIAGKSGHVTISFEYTNNAKETVTIGEKEQTIYTPFVVASGLILDGDNFSNITVTNGTVVSDGNKQVVLGMAFPGLVDSLNGDEIKDNEVLEKIEEKIEIPSNVVVEADAKDFELGMTLTVVSSDVMNSLGLEDLDTEADYDEAKEKVEDFKDATVQLIDGSKQLNDGAGKLSDGTGKLKDGSVELANGISEYTNGVSKVSDGVSQVADGASKLDNGIGQVAEGASKLSSGASTLSSGVSTAKTGASQLDEGAKTLDKGAGDLKDGISSAKSGAETLDGGIGQVDTGAGNLADGAAQVKEGVNSLIGQVQTIGQGVGQAAGAASAISSGIDAVVAATSVETSENDENIQAIVKSGVLTEEQLAGVLAKNNVTAETFATYGISDAQYSAIQGAILQVMTGVVDSVATSAARTGAVEGANAAKSQINAAITTAGASGSSLQGGAQALAQSLNASAAQLGSDEVAAKLNQLSVGVDSLATGASTLKAGTAQLKAGSSELVKGLGKLETGAGKLKDGTSSLATGSGSLVEGLGKLEAGAGELSLGASTLADGTSQLKDGSSKLTSGFSQLTDGLGKLNANSSKLVSGANELSDGASQLNDGALELFNGTKKLNDGMVQFDEEGVQKLSSVFDTNLSTMSDRIKAITDLAKSYKSFSGSSEEEDSAVRFIIESEGVKAK